MTTTIETGKTIQGRWGFYPCDKAIYLKLKRLNFLSYMSLRAEKAYDRWNNKLPKNRFSKRWVRNDKGQKIHYVIGDPIPEPKMGCSIFHSTWPVTSKRKLIEADYKNARYPKKNAEDVKPLNLTEQDIDRLLFEAEAWYASFV